MIKIPCLRHLLIGLWAIGLPFTVLAEPPNLSLLTLEVKAYHDTGDYDKELTKVITTAQNYILDRIEHNNKKAHPEKLAIVLDIDETSLSNYKKMVARQFGGNQEVWHKEVEAADSPAIKPMLTLFETALKHKVSVFFVTGRRESERRATLKNLEFAGYHDWSGLYLKPNDYKHPTIIPFKSGTRAQITQKGFKIIASIGDQRSDLLGGFAEKTFKLPNPYYYLP